MNAPNPGTHWMVAGTVHVVDRVTVGPNPVCCTVTEDGFLRSFTLEYWADVARPATDEEVGLANTRPGAKL